MTRLNISENNNTIPSFNDMVLGDVLELKDKKLVITSEQKTWTQLTDAAAPQSLSNFSIVINTVHRSAHGPELFEGRIYYKNRSLPFEVYHDDFANDPLSFVKKIFEKNSIRELPKTSLTSDEIIEATFAFHTPDIREITPSLGWNAKQKTFTFPNFHIRDGQVIEHQSYFCKNYSFSEFHVTDLELTKYDQFILESNLHITSWFLDYLVATTPLLFAPVLKLQTPNLLIARTDIVDQSRIAASLGMNKMTADSKHWPKFIDSNQKSSLPKEGRISVCLPSHAWGTSLLKPDTILFFSEHELNLEIINLRLFRPLQKLLIEMIRQLTLKEHHTFEEILYEARQIVHQLFPIDEISRRHTEILLNPPINQAFSGLIHTQYHNNIDATNKLICTPKAFSTQMQKHIGRGRWQQVYKNLISSNILKRSQYETDEYSLDTDMLSEQKSKIAKILQLCNSSWLGGCNSQKLPYGPEISVLPDVCPYRPLGIPGYTQCNEQEYDYEAFMTNLEAHNKFYGSLDDWNSWRLLDWRAYLADNLFLQMQRHGRISWRLWWGYYDSLAFQYAIFLFGLHQGRLQDDHAYRRISGNLKAIKAAHEIRYNKDPLISLQLECCIIAKMDETQICRQFKITPKVLQMYHDLFFDVNWRIEASGLIPSLLEDDRFNPSDFDSSKKFYDVKAMSKSYRKLSYSGGPVVCEHLWECFRKQALFPPNPLPKGFKLSREEQRQRLILEIVILFEELSHEEKIFTSVPPELYLLIYNDKASPKKFHKELKKLHKSIMKNKNRRIDHDDEISFDTQET